MSCHPEQTVWHESSLAIAFTLHFTCPGQTPNQFMIPEICLACMSAAIQSTLCEALLH